MHVLRQESFHGLWLGDYGLYHTWDIPSPKSLLARALDESIRLTRWEPAQLQDNGELCPRPKCHYLKKSKICAPTLFIPGEVSKGPLLAVAEK